MGDNNEVRDLRELLTEIKVSIGELRTEMVGMRGVASDVKEIGKVADRALQKTIELEKDLDNARSFNKWAFGLAVTSMLGILGLLLR